MLEQRNDMNQLLSQETIEKMNLYDRFSLWCFHYFHPNCCRIKIDKTTKASNCVCFDYFDYFDFCMFCDGCCSLI